MRGSKADIVSVGLLLKQEREKLGLSKAKAAKKMCIDKNIYCNYENMSAEPSIKVYSRISSFYDFEEEFLFSIVYPDFIGKYDNLIKLTDFSKKHKIPKHRVLKCLNETDENNHIKQKSLIFDEFLILNMF